MRILALTVYTLLIFTAGNVSGWKVARWADPILDARDRVAAASSLFGGFWDEP